MTMEDVWKDINLSYLYDHRFNHDPNLQGMSLQDFLGRPFAKDTPPRPAPPPPPPATTRLNLNSVPEFHFFRTVQNSALQPPRPVSPKASFEGLASSSPAGSNASGRKRAHNSGNSSGDHRHKRMIKNRESAARSRARKQAYTNELELEVAHLMKENAKLIRQYQQLRIEAAAAPKNRKLYRTSSAPL
ncbi:PREDICTED: bZIP transcription factor 27-like [Ipomoea nil]|uniref:bZIP transcription factor 27-like n=1 Tax=Ipomoea nil TaxID=35883 RepID=UPI00090146AD|nr:PREDICTED: bZIP transcription factor 27-like [Ipomoea nil]